MAIDRFQRLNTRKLKGASPSPVSKNSKRFVHLEIGSVRHHFVKASAPTRAAHLCKCPHCQQVNEKGRDLCWACFQKMNVSTKKVNEQPIEVSFQGKIYRSDQANLPYDIRALMKMIRTQGYSGQVIEKWKKWRKTL